VIDAFAFVTCDICGWEGCTDVLIDTELPRSMQTQNFTCPLGHDNEQDINQ